MVGQTWGALDPWYPERFDVASSLVINPVAIWQLTDEWYVSDGDMVLRYNWDESEWFVPIGLRIGRLFVGEKSTWNIYGEYQTSLVYRN